MKMRQEPIVLFDGVCNLCNGAVQWVIKRDPSASIHFAPLQSDVGEELIKSTFNSDVGLNSVVLIENNGGYLKSTAILKICKHLKGLWKLGIVLLIIPRPIRDFIYDWIAKNRYKWFGKRNECMMPTKDLKKRFLS